jgi:hypothetical protein
MCFLKKRVPLCWDEMTQHSFEALKRVLTSSPLLIPLDYGKEFLLYMVFAESTIGMVLVQEDVTCEDHFIYYLS